MASTSETLEAIQKTLEDLSKHKDDHDQSFVTTHEKIDELKEQVSRIDIHIRGNGRPGLTERVSLVEQKVKTVERARRGTVTIITSVVGFITAVTVAVLTLLK